jgi:hypothetical protein
MAATPHDVREAWILDIRSRPRSGQPMSEHRCRRRTVERLPDQIPGS